MKCGNCQSLFPKLEFANNSTICKICKTYFKFIKKSKSDNCYQCTLCSHQDMQMKRLLLHLQNEHPTITGRVSIQGVKSLGGHFACLCRRFEFYEIKKKCY